MLTNDLPVLQSCARPKQHLRAKWGKESDRVQQPLPELFRGSLKVKGIDLPLSLRHVAQAAASVPAKPEDSAYLSLTERTVKATYKLPQRKSVSTVFLKIDKAHLPAVHLNKGGDFKSQSKHLLQLRSQLQLYRYGIDCSSGHRIRQMSRTKPCLRPLLV